MNTVHIPKEILDNPNINLSDNNIKDIRPKIVSTGAALLDDVTKKLIVKAFKTEPMDNYGSAEAGQIAWHCSERNYHINIDMVYIEILKEDKAIIEDLIKAAHNNAKSQLKSKTSEEISKATGGFGIPGFKWPL